jgi:hypothetical protein
MELLCCIVIVTEESSLFEDFLLSKSCRCAYLVVAARHGLKCHGIILLPIISGTGDSIYTTVVVADVTVAGSTGLSWEPVYKISRCGVHVPISYIHLFEGIYPAWCDFVIDSTDSVQQILCNFEKNATGTLAMIRQTSTE